MIIYTRTVNTTNMSTKKVWARSHIHTDIDIYPWCMIIRMYPNSIIAMSMISLRSPARSSHVRLRNSKRA